MRIRRMINLPDIVAMKEGPVKTAALAEWVQAQWPSEASPPILVGGAAVELLTGGAYTTGDLDFVGHVPSGVQAGLLKAGFHRQGRHYIYEEGQIFLEFPGSALAPHERSVTVSLGRHKVLLVSPEDLLIDRLQAWVHWKSAVDGANACLLFSRQFKALDQRRLRALAEGAGVSEALAKLGEFASPARGRRLRREAILRWALKGV